MRNTEIHGDEQPGAASSSASWGGERRAELHCDLTVLGMVRLLDEPPDAALDLLHVSDGDEPDLGGAGAPPAAGCDIGREHQVA